MAHMGVKKSDNQAEGARRSATVTTHGRGFVLKTCAYTASSHASFMSALDKKINYINSLREAIGLLSRVRRAARR